MSEGHRKVGGDNLGAECCYRGKCGELWEHGGEQSAGTLVPDGKFLSQEKGKVIGKVKHGTVHRMGKSS